MAEDSSNKNKDYGLPNVEPQPIDRNQPGIAKEVIVSKPSKKKKDNRLMIVVLSVIVLLILASLLYMIFWDKESSDTTPKTPVEDRAVLAPDESDQSAENNQDVAVGSDENPENAEVISEEPGSITTISQRTNRYYIFLGSYKFKAYARRHAEKLAADGFAVKLITPDNWVGVRVAVGNYTKKEEALVDAQQLESKYGNEVVISKY